MNIRSLPNPLIAGLCAIGLPLGLASAQVVIIEQEGFESAEGDYGFSVSPAFTGSGTGDYWDRILNSTIGMFGNEEGAFLVATSSSPGSPAGGFVVTMDAVNITGYVNTKVRVRLAAPGGSAQYDSLDFLWIEANVDGAGWTPVARFESTDNAGNNFNQSLSLDADANGNGDGVVVLGASFLDLEYPISTGSSVQVRARMLGNNNNEPMGVDDFRIVGELPATNPPVLGGVPAGALAYVEGDGKVELAPALTATDSDSNITSATVAISSNYNAGEDTLVFTPLGNGVTVLSNAGGVLTLTGNQPASNYQAALRAVKYENTNVTNPDLALRTVTFTASDGTANSNMPTQQIMLTNTFQTFTIPHSEEFETDGDGDRYALIGAFDSASNAYWRRLSNSDGRTSLGDVEGTIFFAGERTSENGMGGSPSALIIRLDSAGLSNLGVDVLLAAPGGNAYDSADRLLVSYQFDNSGPFIPLADFRSTAGGFNTSLSQDTTGDGMGDGLVLSGIFQDFNLPIPDSGNLLQIKIEGITSADGEEVAFDNIRITGVAGGAAPVLSGLDAGPVAYAEGAGAVQVTSAASISDADSAVLSSATVQVVDNHLSSEDVLDVSGALPGGITSAFDSGSGTLTLTAAPTASLADFEAALALVTYENTNTINPSEATRSIGFRVIDETAVLSNQATVAVTVTDAVLTNVLPFRESFETDGRGTRYRVPGFFDSDPDSFFTSIPPSRTDTALIDADGEMVFGGESTASDGAGLHAVEIKLDTSDKKDLTLDILLAAPGGNSYDSTDYLLIESSADGGPFVRLASFRSAGGGFNTTLSEDITNDGKGDGTVLTPTFQNFNYTLPDADLTVMRISAMSNAGGEEMAWDNVRVDGTESVPPIADLADPLNGGSIVSNVLNTRGFIDVTFSDVDSTLDAGTIADVAPEFTLTGPGVASAVVNGAGVLQSGTTYRYSVTGSFQPGTVSVNFLAGTFLDSEENDNEAEAESFTVLNSPPTLVADTIERHPTQSVKVAVADLLANDSDPEMNGPLTVTAVTYTGGNGGTVSLSGDLVFYTPAPGYKGDDTFTYTAEDSLGASSTGTVTVKIIGDNTPSLNIVAMETLGDGSVKTTFAGIPGRTYQIQKSPDLVNWTDVEPIVADAQGRIVFVDGPPAPPSQFYRTVSP